MALEDDYDDEGREISFISYLRTASATAEIYTAICSAVPLDVTGWVTRCQLKIQRCVVRNLMGLLTYPL